MLNTKSKDAESAFVNELRRGGEASFKELVSRFQDKVYNICFGFLNNAEDAEDTAQEVFIEVHRSLRLFKGDAALDTWIYRIAVNKSMERIRYAKREKRFAWLTSLFGREEETGSFHRNELHPGVQLENRERAQILYGAIDRLPDNQRIAFITHKVEGLSHQEVAEVMQLSLSAVESLMHRARKNLQKMLHDFYNNENSKASI